MVNEDIIIDRNDLDSECEKAPAFYQYWSEQESNYESELSKYEAELSRAIRSLDEKELREKHGIGKITDASVASIIKSDEQCTYLKDKYNLAQSHRKSWEKKIALLDTLARLHSSGYFAKIESKPNARAMIAESIKEKIRETIASNENRKTRRRK